MKAHWCGGVLKLVSWVRNRYGLREHRCCKCGRVVYK